ncbi:thiamine diphosphokinase [Helicobacter brantae]|uniref:Thiamine diphosphokinase n=1 Tax=Helicobacter brantae TaxID=375927 RepID=A0A3D8J2E0_9HELI|nr:thiamine diphosphokinase [Helicobacter brantae]RDU71712.1 thiamine diphosphokinase [Helicobacter brantae]
MRAVILANGSFPTSTSLIEELRGAEFLAVCDGAVRHLQGLGIEPSVVIGDLDSISQGLKEKYAQKLVHIQEQESNDLSKAFFYCVDKGFREFVILGASGEREDHTIANISLLFRFGKITEKIVMKSDFGSFSVHSLPCEVKSQKGNQISLFTSNPSLALSSKGLKYPLASLSLPLWASGTLNEALDESFSLSGDEGLVVVYQTNY